VDRSEGNETAAYTCIRCEIVTFQRRKWKGDSGAIHVLETVGGGEKSGKANEPSTYKCVIGACG
jgi:hypothetical protein